MGSVVGSDFYFDNLQSCFDFANLNCNPSAGTYFDLTTSLRMTAVGTFATSGSGISTAYVSGPSSAAGATYLQISTNLAANFTEYSFEAWINPNASTGGGGGIWGHYAGSPTFRGLGITATVFGGTNSLLVYHGTGTATTIAGLSGIVDYGSWQHLGVTYSNNVATFYKNGASFGTTSLAALTWTTSLFLRLGVATNTNSNGYGGQIGLCRVWSTAFSSAQMQYLYTVNKQRYGLP
jgi:hypothetical protein